MTIKKDKIVAVIPVKLNSDRVISKNFKSFFNENSFTNNDFKVI